MNEETPHLNVSQAIEDVEIALRNFISVMLKNKFGNDWINNCGLDPSRVETFDNARTKELERLKSAKIEERLIYYSELSDLLSIVIKNWELFTPVFLKKSKFELYMGTLIGYRIPNSHSRILLVHQKQLAIGISGELRNQIVTYRSKMETGEDIYPRLESITDNLGNFWDMSKGHMANEQILHPGDELVLTINASDPQGGKLKYALHPQPQWQDSNIMTIRITEKHINEPYMFVVVIQSDRSYHADGEYDSAMSWSYKVRPLPI